MNHEIVFPTVMEQESFKSYFGRCLKSQELCMCYDRGWINFKLDVKKLKADCRKYWLELTIAKQSEEKTSIMSSLDKITAVIG